MRSKDGETIIARGISQLVGIWHFAAPDILAATGRWFRDKASGIFALKVIVLPGKTFDGMGTSTGTPYGVIARITSTLGLTARYV